MQGLFDRGCLRKMKRADLPKGARIMGSRFLYKIKRYRHAATLPTLSAQCHTCQVCAFFSRLPRRRAGSTSVLVDLTQGFIQAGLPKGGKTIYITPPKGWEEDPDTVYEVEKPLYVMPHSDGCLHKTWSQCLNSVGFESVGYEKWVKKEGSEQTAFGRNNTEMLDSQYVATRDVFKFQMG